MVFTQLMSVSFAVDGGEILQGGTLLKSMPGFLALLPFSSFSSSTQRRKRRICHAAVATAAVSTLTRAQEMDETIRREALKYPLALVS